MGVEALQSANSQAAVAPTLAEKLPQGSPVLDGFGAVSTAYEAVSQRLKFEAVGGWRTATSTANRVAAGVMSSALGVQRVFSALDQDVKNESKLYSRTAMAIPMSMLQIAAAAEVASLTAAGAAAVGIGTGVGGALVMGAAAVGSAYALSLGIDYVDRRISEWLYP